jgi:hypothetical protein
MKFIRYHKSEGGYGRTLWVGPVRFGTTGTMTPMWPHTYLSHDEDCNPVFAMHLYPLVSIDIWWKGFKRTGLGICDSCQQELEEMLNE